MLLALILRRSVRGGWWLIGSCSDANVGCDPWCTEAVNGFMTKFDGFADNGEGALEVCAISAVRTRKEPFRSGCSASDAGRAGLPWQYSLNLIPNALILHTFQHSLALCDVLAHRCGRGAHGNDCVVTLKPDLRNNRRQPTSVRGYELACRRCTYGRSLLQRRVAMMLTCWETDLDVSLWSCANL